MMNDELYQRLDTMKLAYKLETTTNRGLIC